MFRWGFAERVEWALLRRRRCAAKLIRLSEAMILMATMIRCPDGSSFEEVRKHVV